MLYVYFFMSVTSSSCCHVEIAENTWMRAKSHLKFWLSSDCFRMVLVMMSRLCLRLSRFDYPDTTKVSSWWWSLYGQSRVGLCTSQDNNAKLKYQKYLGFSQEWDPRLFPEVYHDHPPQINSQKTSAYDILSCPWLRNIEKQLSTDPYSKGRGAVNEQWRK